MLAMSRDEAQRWVRRAAVCATIIGVLDLLIWIVRDGSGDSPFRSLSLLDAVLTLALAAGLWRKSRIAACVLLLYWVYGKVHQLITTDFIAAPVLGLVFLGLLFLFAARGTFVLHAAPELAAAQEIEPDVTPR